jgi:uncharacterized protein YheU (UPF0270 family)
LTDQKEHLVIPYDQLSPEALSGLIGEFVTRDGTDSGYTRGTLAENVAMVRRQLDAGEAVVVFDSRTQTCNIVPAEVVRENMPKDLNANLSLLENGRLGFRIKAAGIWEPQAQQRLRRGWQQDENAEPGPKMLFSGILRR